MKGTPGYASIFALMGIFLLSNQGCTMKSIQSEGDSQFGQSAGKKDGDNPSFPSMSRGGTNGELSGFSTNPSEERLSQSGVTASLSPSDLNARRRAELTRDEQAAREAGLEDVFFGYDQWNLSDAGMQALNHDAGWLKEHPGVGLQIEGHCDERGTSDYNVVLGDKRARATRAYLIELGVNTKQMTTVSYGKERPFCSEHTESCYQQNRRGHILFRTKK